MGNSFKTNKIRIKVKSLRVLAVNFLSETIYIPISKYIFCNNYFSNIYNGKKRMNNVFCEKAYSTVNLIYIFSFFFILLMTVHGHHLKKKKKIKIPKISQCIIKCIHVLHLYYITIYM